MEISELHPHFVVMCFFLNGQFVNFKSREYFQKLKPNVFGVEFNFEDRQFSCE
jgi:hypothetical protein